MICTRLKPRYMCWFKFKTKLKWERCTIWPWKCHFDTAIRNCLKDLVNSPASRRTGQHLYLFLGWDNPSTYERKQLSNKTVIVKWRTRLCKGKSLIRYAILLFFAERHYWIAEVNKIITISPFLRIITFKKYTA